MVDFSFPKSLAGRSSTGSGKPDDLEPGQKRLRAMMEKIKGRLHLSNPASGSRLSFPKSFTDRKE